jgi:Bacterial aa3 type cytochrome c oxidase subunit IV
MNSPFLLGSAREVGELGKDPIKPRHDGCRARRGAIDGRRSFSGTRITAMASGNDMKAHTSTYDAFIANLKWSVPLIALISAIVVLLIAT